MSDDELLHAFRTCALTHSEWNHRAHVRVAYLYLQQYGYELALQEFRTGIQKLNASHQVPESATRGYNETITVAFLRLVWATIGAYGRVLPTPNSDAFCDEHTQLMSKHDLRLFYSPERRLHPDAKYGFVEPDLAKLPDVEEL